MINNIPLTFFGQFKNPQIEDDILIRIFVYTSKQGYDYGSGIVKAFVMDDETLNKQIHIEPPTNCITYEPFLIKEWNISKELKEYEYIEKYILNKELKLRDSSENHYWESVYVPSLNCKVGGTSVFCQYQNTKNKSIYNNFIQMSECNELPFSWGDSGIAHIYNTQHNEYYLNFDCC